MTKTSYIKLIKSAPKELLFGLIYMFSSSFGKSYVLALFIPYLSKSFNITPFELSNYYGVMTLISGFLLLYTGSLIDRINLKTYSFCIITLILGAGILLGLTHSLVIMLSCLFLIRHLGQGLMTHISVISTTKFFNKNRGRALSLASSGGLISTIITPVLYAWMLTHYHWREILISLTLFTFLICIALLLPPLRPKAEFFKNKKKDTPSLLSNNINEKELNWGRKQLLRHRHFWFIIPLVITPYYVSSGLIFHQGAIAIHQNWPITLLASGFIAYGTAGFFTNFFIGSLVDSFSAQKIQKFLLAPLALSLVSILISNSALTVYLYLGFMGASVAMVRGTSAMWADVYGTKHLGAIKSLIGVIIINATALGPIIFGYLLEVTTIPNIIIGHLIYMACITGLAYFAIPPKNRRPK